MMTFISAMSSFATASTFDGPLKRLGSETLNVCFPTIRSVQSVRNQKSPSLPRRRRPSTSRSAISESPPAAFSMLVTVAPSTALTFDLASSSILSIVFFDLSSTASTQSTFQTKTHTSNAHKLLLFDLWSLSRNPLRNPQFISSQMPRIHHLTSYSYSIYYGWCILILLPLSKTVTLASSHLLHVYSVQAIS